MLLSRESFPVLPRDPSGHAISYVCKDGGALCGKCVNENAARVLSCDDECPDDDQWNVIGAQQARHESCNHCYVPIKFS